MNTANLRQRTLLNVISNYAGKLFNLGVWFFLTPYLVRTLGADDYGLWVLIGSIAAYGTLLEFGIADAVSKYIAEFRVRGDVRQARQLVATAVGLYLGLGLAAFLASVLIAPAVPGWFGLPAAQSARASQLVILTGLAIALELPSTTTYAVLRGLQRFEFANLISILGTALMAALTVAVVALGGGVLGLAAVALPVTLLMQWLSLQLVHRAAPDLQLSWRDANRQLVRTVAAFSSSLFVVRVAGQLQSKTDEIVIGLYLPVAAVTPYSLARRLSEIPQMLTNQFMKVIMPLASQLAAADDRARLRSLYVVSTRLTLAIGVPLAAGVTLLARPFLSVWVGPAYADADYLVAILAAASLIDTSQWPAASVLQGMARHRWLAVTALASALINLALSLILIRPLGVAGVALGTLIPTSLEALGFVMPYALRVNGVTWREALAEIFWPTLAPALPMAAVLVGLREWLRPAGYLSLLAVGAAGGLVYLAGYAAACWGKPERQLGAQLWSEGRARLAAWRRARAGGLSRSDPDA